MNKITLRSILIEINYFKNFETNFLKTGYPTINYGSKLNSKTFNGLFDATQKYSYNGTIDEQQFISWHKTLNNPETSSENLLCTILEIFDWGKVLTSNVKTVLELYKNGTLGSYIQDVADLLKLSQTVTTVSCPTSKNIIWSSGWTKVYSFIDNDILIYDSRVSAFLNHTLTYKCHYSDHQLAELKKMTTNLFNFGGATERQRVIKDNQFGFRKAHPSGLKGFNANLISSWIVQLLNEELGISRKIRDYERAFFMLGFDLNQLTAPIESSQ